MQRPPTPFFATLAALTVVLAGCLKTSPVDEDEPQTPTAKGMANVQVTHLNGPASEVTLAINPKDPLNLVGGAKDYTLGSDPGPGCSKYNVWSGVYGSQDGGLTWINQLMPGHPGDADTNLLSHYNCNSDPVVVFGADGTAYYSGLAYGATTGAATQGVCPGDQEALLCGRSVWIAKSADSGVTWDGFVNVAVSEDQAIILDKQWFATDPNNPANLVMTWIQFMGVSMAFMIAASSDAGATWTPPLTLAEVNTPFHQFAMPQYGPDGTVYVVWNNFGTGNGPDLPNPLPIGVPGTSQVMFTKTRAPSSPSFLPAVGVAPIHNLNSPLPHAEFRVNSIPILAVAQEGSYKGHLYVAWADQQGDHADILLIRSTDGGDTWSAPVRVNQDAVHDQFMTWITTDEEGGVNVVFYDRSYDPDNTQLDLTLARSTDNGATFHQVRLTSESWAVPAGCYHQEGFSFIGDYIGLAAGNGVLHPFWADGRTGRCEVFTASVPYEAVDAGFSANP